MIDLGCEDAERLDNACQHIHISIHITGASLVELVTCSLFGLDLHALSCLALESQLCEWHSAQFRVHVHFRQASIH